jgi:succinate-acetate transporter protein
MFMIPSLGIEAAYKGDMRAYSFAIGICLILWCFVTLIFLIGALRTNIAIVATFLPSTSVLLPQPRAIP